MKNSLKNLAKYQVLRDISQHYPLKTVDFSEKNVKRASYSTLSFGEDLNTRMGFL